MGQPEAVAVHLEDMDVMREAVEERAGEPLGTEHGRPLIERQIARDQRAASLVALAEDLEQQLGPSRRERHIAEFVDDQQLVAGELTLKSECGRSIAKKWILCSTPPITPIASPKSTWACPGGCTSGTNISCVRWRQPAT